MFGKVLLKNETYGKGIIIPSSAIQGTDNQPRVYVVKNGKPFAKHHYFKKDTKQSSCFKWIK